MKLTAALTSRSERVSLNYEACIRLQTKILKKYIHFHRDNFISFQSMYRFGCVLTKLHIFVQVQGHMFIQGNYIYWTLLHSWNSRNIYRKIVPSHFMIIVSFTITISWIKYSYNFSSVEGWRNCWYDRGFRNIITVLVVFATIVQRNTTCEALPASDTISSPKSDISVRQRAVYI